METTRKLREDAFAALDKRKWQRAAKLFDELVTAQPQDPQWSQRAGDAYRKHGDKSQALAAFTRAAEQFAKQGFLLKAIAACKVALEIDDKHTATQALMARLYATRGVPGPLPKRMGDAPSIGDSPALATAPASAAAVAPAAPSKRTIPPGATLDQVELSLALPGSKPSEEFRAFAGLDVNELELGLLDDDIEVVPEDDVARAAERILPRVPLFSSLDPERLQKLIGWLGLVPLISGETLFSAGEPAEALYIVASGRIDVEDPTDPDGAVSFGEGDFFGELALLTDRPHRTTATAGEDTTVLALDRLMVSALVEDSPQVLRVLLRFLRDGLAQNVARQSPLFAPLLESDRAHLARRLRLLESRPGALLMQEGHPPAGLCILAAGECKVSRGGESIGSLGPGEVFGESAVLGAPASSVSLRATTRCFLLMLDPTLFTEVMRACPEVLDYLLHLTRMRESSWGPQTSHMRFL